MPRLAILANLQQSAPVVVPSLPGGNLDDDEFTGWFRRLRRQRREEVLVTLYATGDITEDELRVLAVAGG